jgi:TonB-linked SusC/RagA family outer membrane protein
MKKTISNIWLLMTNVDFHRLLVTRKIMTIILVCGLTFPAYTLNAGNLSTSDQQQLRIGGTITDASTGQVMPGVNIQIKGTSIGVIADASGKYSLSVTDPNAILVFSFIGYSTKELPVGGRSVIDLALAPELKGLDEVVVVGYGTVKRADLTGSVGSIPSRDIKDIAITRVEQALSGRVAGVQVKAVSGEPGVGPQIRIRGIGSISAGAAPLYVVDGFPTDNIQTLNPNDIETLDILKDASATAIYGSRGSNGVVIINTKRGKAGKASITFDTYYGMQKVLKIPKMKNAIEQAHYGYDGYVNANLDAGNSIAGDPLTWKIPMPPQIMEVLNGTNTYDSEPLNEILQTAPTKQYQLTASGGNENFKYALSGEYEKTDGIIIESNFSRYSVRANIDAKLTKRLTLKLNINPSFTAKRALPSYTGGEGTLIGGALGTFNWIPLIDSQGNYTNEHGRQDLSEINNSVAVARETQTSQNSLRLLQNININYEIFNGLSFNIMLGSNILAGKGARFTPSLPVFLSVPAVGVDNASLTTNWIGEYTVNYIKSFGKHNITALVGYTAQKEHSESNTMTSNKYPNNLVPTLSATSGLITGGSGDIYEWSIVSYLARFNYDYNNKYYLTTSIRADGSSRFGSENRYAFFPSVALAWRIKEEPFLKDVSFLNELKLRASYGKSGNNNIGNYESYATINYEKYVLNNAAIGGFSQAKIENPFLTWEKQEQINFGFDAGIFESRIHLTVDHFQSKNTNLLLNVNIPATTGFSNSLQNVGEVSNKGWEFVVSTVNLKNKFSWTTDFNLSTYKNKVVSLGPSGDPIYTTNNITMIGQPIGMFYGLKLDGVFMSQAELDKGPIWNPGAADRSRVGDFRFVDISGPNGVPDGIISSADFTTIGSPYPDFNYGMTNNFSYGNITLSFNLQGTYGSQVYCVSRTQGNSGRGRLRGYAFNNDYWKSEAEPGDGKTQRPNNAPTGGARQIGEQFLDNGSFLRVNNITAGYTLPENISRRLSVTSIRFYVNATNPLIFTKYVSFNPDVSISDNPLTPGNEQNDYPLAKGLVIGLNIGF